MNPGIDIRLALPCDRDAILRFVSRMGFNPRSELTWDQLNMTAMTAWLGDELIGAIPLEPRPLLIRPGVSINSVHQTVVAVDPRFRGRGIGSQMQKAIEANPPAQAHLTTVFRENPQSDAYRWYVKNGFRPATHIDSYFLETPLARLNSKIKLQAFGDGLVDFATIAKQWSSVGKCGCVDQTRRPLQHWLAVHPYGQIYKFYLLTNATGYAVIGVGRLHSETERVDILDLVMHQSASNLIDGIVQHAAAQTWRPIRWPIAANDLDSISLAAQSGFQKKWGFDLLIKELDSPPVAAEDLARWRFSAIDYI